MLPPAPELAGFHHVTAIAADAARNCRFYTEVLGLRLVKRTVNQDDVSAWHLFYADAVGSPGIDLTFFVWPLPSERRGSRSVARTGFAVASETDLGWWEERLRGFGIATRRTREPGGRPGLRFADPEGQRLLLTVEDGPSRAHPWARSPVPAERQLRGLGPVVLAFPKAEPSARFLVELLGFRFLGEGPDPEEGEARVWRFACGPGGSGAELQLRVQRGLPGARQGAGAVHHVAFRVADRGALAAWAERLGAAGVRHSGEVDRHWFRSLYFREPGGVLFELATDGPGFTVDEPVATLGERLVLPPFLEPHRATIEAGLPPLRPAATVTLR